MFRIDKASVDISADPARINIAQEVPEAPIGQEPLVDALASAAEQEQGGSSDEMQPIDQPADEEPQPAGITEEEAQNQAQQILEDAKTQAEQIIAQAQAEAQDVHDAAAREGYEAGREEGKSTLIQQAEEEAGEFSAMTKSMLDEFNKMMQQGNISAAKLAISIAEKIIGFELDRNDFAYLNIAQQAVERINGTGKLVMRVNPEDYQRFFAEGATLQGLPGDVELEIVEDSRVKKGGCIVETGTESVNAGVDKQLEKVKQAFDLDEEVTSV